MLKTMLMLTIAIIAAVTIMILLAVTLPVDSKWYIPLLLLTVSLFGIIAAITEVRIKRYWAAKKAKSDIDIFDTLFEPKPVMGVKEDLAECKAHEIISERRDNATLISHTRQAMAEKRLKDNLESARRLSNTNNTIV